MGSQRVRYDWATEQQPLPKVSGIIQFIQGLNRTKGGGKLHWLPTWMFELEYHSYFALKLGLTPLGILVLLFVDYRGWHFSLFAALKLSFKQQLENPYNALPYLWETSHCSSPWQFLQIRTQTLLQVGLGPGLDGHAMAELRSVRHQSGVTHSGTRPPCPSPTPGVHSDSRPSSQWCHPVISFSVVPFSSCPQSLPASEYFPMSQLFTWSGRSIGVSALASVLPKNTQDWPPSEWTGWISLQSKGLSRVFSNTTVQKTLKSLLQHHSSKASILWCSAFFTDTLVLD